MKTSAAVHARAHALRALSVVLVFTGAACRRDDGGAKTDADLSRDLALAASVQQVQPTLQPLQDTGVAPAPAATREPPSAAPATIRTRTIPRRPTRVEMPRPVPEAQVRQPSPAAAAVAPALPAAAPKEFGSGTSVSLTSGSRVCTNTNLAGDKFVAMVNSAVTGSNGATLPAGATIVLEVASVTAGSSADNAQIALRVRSIVINDKTYEVSGDVTPLASLEKTRVVGEDPNAGKKKVIGGAVAGAILGQIMGKSTKATVIGAAAGAAVGAAAAKAGEKWEGCLPEGSAIRLTLNAPLVIS